MTQENTSLLVIKVMKEFNIGIPTINEFLKKKGLIKEDLKATSKIDYDFYVLLQKEFQSEKLIKQQSMKVVVGIDKKEPDQEQPKQTLPEKPVEDEPVAEPVAVEPPQVKVVGKIDVSPEKKQKSEPEKKESKEKKQEETKAAPEENQDSKQTEPTEKSEKKHVGPKVVGKIDVVEKKEPKQKQTQVRNEEPEEPKKPEVAEPEVKETEVKENIAEPDVAEVPQETAQEIIEPANNRMETQYEKLSGPTIVGKIDLGQFDKKPEKTEKKDKTKDGKVPVASSHDEKVKKRKRRRIDKGPSDAGQNKGKGRSDDRTKEKTTPEVSDEEIQKQIKETLARLTSSGKSKASKYRRQKRDIVQQHQQAELEEIEKQKHVLKVTEFLTANDLASMMNTHVNQVISTCLNLGLFVSINQRLDAEAITLVADEFGFDVEFVSIDIEEELGEPQDAADTLQPRHPVVTVMGHVDHGKTSLLDNIRKTNVIAGEAGGITQHIGAYEVQLPEGKKITFLDTPGHEAFTAMRARGAKLTDIAIIVVAADDKVMPQTTEAINHARAAAVPMVFAINKIDKPNAQPEKIKEALSQMNILVEDWGGKFQSQEISAKHGVNLDLLLEKVLLEAELLDLKANPNKFAAGAVIESSLEKGRGYVSKILIQSGTLRVGDIAVAGCFHGKVKAMFNERNQPIHEAGPSTPVLLLGLDGAPQAGDKFNVYETEKEAKQVCVKRQQLIREQGLRTQKHITLDEIGRRIAIGDFKELNVIVKGDVDGSIEALSDSLLKLSTNQIQVNVIHKSVGQITESDVLLASASDAIIVGFQVRPSVSARKLAEQEQIDIRTYSVIYDAIEEIKSAMEGMLSPTIEEKIVCNVEIREVFKITKVGSVAGCMVLDGKINRNTKVRLIRDGIVIYNGSLSTLKRFKDDVKEVATGYECGLSIENFNDLKVGDILEGYEITERKATL
jgi:translation initiation factor IF-2